MKKLLLLGAVVCLANPMLHSEQKSADDKTVRAEQDNVGTLANIDDWTAKITQSTKPTVVKFFAPWCGYCVKMTPVFKALAEEYKDQFSFYEVNIDQSKDLAANNGVRGIPVFKMFDKDGNKIGEIVGFVSKETFEAKLNSLPK